MEDSARQVVFVPGYMQRGDSWAPVTAGVAERYRAQPLDFSTHTFEGRVGEILDAVEPGGIGVGYSMGGRLLLHAALRDPERFGALVLVSSSAGIEDDAERERRRGDEDMLASWIERQPIDTVVERWERLPLFETQSAGLKAAQRPQRLTHDPAQLAELMRSAGQGASAPVWDRLGELEMPVLLIAGERDDRYNQAAHRMARELPNGKVATVSNAGHAPQFEAPDRFNHLLKRFLREVSG